MLVTTKKWQAKSRKTIKMTTYLYPKMIILDSSWEIERMHLKFHFTLARSDNFYIDGSGFESFSEQSGVYEHDYQQDYYQIYLYYHIRSAVTQVYLKEVSLEAYINTWQKVLYLSCVRVCAIDWISSMTHIYHQWLQKRYKYKRYIQY